MASVQQKGNKFYVVYRGIKPGYVSPKSIWESYDDAELAQMRMHEINFKKHKRRDLALECDFKLTDVCNYYTRIYGKLHWGVSTYTSNTSYFRNHIFPFFADSLIKNISVSDIDSFIMYLHTKPSKHPLKKGTQTLSRKTVYEILSLLKQVFSFVYSRKWINHNPFDAVTIEKPASKKRDSWNPQTVLQAIYNDKKPDGCGSAPLTEYQVTLVKMILQTLFALSLRTGECLGLQWTKFHAQDAKMMIEQTLERVQIESLNESLKNEVFFIFPSLLKDREPRTRLILKNAKTQESTRMVFMPKGLVSELESWREYQREHIKEDQLTYDLIFCQENGNPISVHYFRKLFYRYVHMQNLPHVVPYSLRQSSADTKMVLSKGDVTTVQAETGHSSPSILLERYTALRDERRVSLSDSMDHLMYDSRVVSPQTDDPITQLNQKIASLLTANPNMLATFDGLVTSLQAMGK